MHRSIAALISALWCTAVLGAQAPAAPHELGIKYMRDSEEYAALARQTYRLATDAVQRAALRPERPAWAVVLDIDETTLDNSTYELERVTYGLPFEAKSWNAWVLRHAAGTVPGVVDFIAAVRRAGGHVAWISDRDTATLDATRVNLRSAGLWNDDDRMCLQDAPERTKVIRRAEVVSGKGACAWAGTAVSVLAFLGDQMGDFPAADEHIPNTGTDAAFGRTCFLLPNSMYGQWVTRVTRDLSR
jgi:5'-nucleotidase (lipoprotein e(P4) family)